MNFVLIHFLARLVVGIFLVVVQCVLWQSQYGWQKNEKKLKQWAGFNLTSSTGEETTIMDIVEDKQCAPGHKGLQQRKSYNNIAEHEQSEALQSVEMQRTGSSQSSLYSQQSASSLKTESGWSKESLEEKIPGQPINFGTIVPGVYRSSYPQETDYPFIQKLGLKTIVTLVDKDIPETFLPFMAANGIQHRHITMEGTKKQAIPVQTMSAILQVIHDKRNHPLLIHCNQGRHRTGCVVAVTRMIQKWDTERILEEYKAYAHPKVREGDVEYISKFQVTDIAHLDLMALVETMPAQPRSIHRPSHLYVASVLIILMFLSISSITTGRGLGAALL